MPSGKVIHNFSAEAAGGHILSAKRNVRPIVMGGNRKWNPMVTANWMRDKRHTSMGDPLGAVDPVAAIIAKTVPPCGLLATGVPRMLPSWAAVAGGKAGRPLPRAIGGGLWHHVTKWMCW